MSGSKSTLLHCLNIDNEVTADEMFMDCITLDGAAIVNIVKTNCATTFQEYATKKFTPYIQKQLKRSKRVDIVWDVYVKNSLKSSARQKRGMNNDIVSKRTIGGSENHQI